MVRGRREARVTVPGFAPFSLSIHPPGELISDHLAAHGIWEPIESALLHRLLEPGMCVIDVGANLGYYTCLAAQRVDPTGRLLAFEPDPANFRLLQANTQQLSGDVIEVHRQALGDRCGSAALVDDPVNKGDVHLGGCGDSVTVVRGDALGLERIDLLKIDTQGWEVRVLRGLAQTLARSGGRVRILVELWPYGLRRAGDSASALVDELLTLGLPVWRIDHQCGGLQPLSPAGLRDLAERVLTVAQRGFVNLLLGAPPEAPDYTAFRA